MTGKKLLAPVERLGELRFDGVHGDAEFFGDFAVGEIFKFAEDEDFAAARRQFRDRGRQQFGFLPAAHGLGNTGRIVEDARLDEFRYRNRMCGRAAAKEVAGGVARRRKKQAARRADGAALAGTKQARVGLLHEVVDIGWADETMEVGAEGGLVRRKFRREPLRRIGSG